jgi:L-threonylcarbamoyladenylate synthase
MTNILSANTQSIDKAAKLLKQGGIVSFPTETVYGLGGNALDDEAIKRIYEIKGRPSHNPLIIHVASLKQAKQYAEFNDIAEQVASLFWPGPLTLILKQKENNGLSPLCTAGLDTIAIRIPSQKTARAILEQCDIPIAAPSANTSGTLSPTRALDVEHDLGNKIDLIITDIACNIGLESTVLDLSSEPYTLLRAGSITAEDLNNDLEISIQNYTPDSATPKSPGQLLKHYAPSIPVRMNAVDLNPGEALLAFGSDKFMGIKGGGGVNDLEDTAKRNLSEGQDLDEAASNLFAMLHDLDRPEHKAIAVMPIPSIHVGLAINDRLKKASEGR